MPNTFNVRTRRAVLVLLGALLLGGCIRSGAVLRSDEAVPVAVAVVLASVDERAVQGGPDAVDRRIADALEARNLVMVPVAAERFVEPFTRARTTPHRLTFLAEEVDGAPVVLLIESTVRFSSQINGRYRWTVDVEATLGHPDGPEPLATRSFTVPVALVYYHEREAEALAEASPVIARQVGALLDGWIGARQAP